MYKEKRNLTEYLKKILARNIFKIMNEIIEQNCNNLQSRKMNTKQLASNGQRDYVAVGPK